MSSYEVRVDNAVREQLSGHPRLYEQNDMPATLTASLKQASKTGGGGAGYPDFALLYDEHPDLVVLVENKYGLDFLELRTAKGVLSKTQRAVRDYAVNGVKHYARQVLASGTYKEVIALGVVGETINGNNLFNVQGFYYYSEDHDPKSFAVDYNTIFTHLQPANFEQFYREIELSEHEKDRALAKSYDDLQKTARELNRKFYDYSVPVEQRAVIVSGMLLAMENKLEPSDLRGDPAGTQSADGQKIYSAIETTLARKNMPHEKRAMMLSTFAVISADPARDTVRTGVIRTGSKAGQQAPNTSINKELFTFIYDHVWKTIDQHSHLDSLGEMYSSFLKYALGDGKENGIVLTPPYVTKFMAELIEVDRNSRVLDPCTGSAGFLVTSMSQMIKDAQEHLAGDDLDAKIDEIKRDQLMGVELDLKMYSLAATNMILRGDGSSQIMKASFFDQVGKRKPVNQFEADAALLNPPFSYTENGMPFALGALDAMVPGGKLAIIIQDSAGTGRAVKTNQQILSKHSLLASIRMPTDLFEPSAGVQTSIYIFAAHQPHDVKKQVRFIDLFEDGYKRTGRGLRTIGNPEQRYEDALEVYRYGTGAENVTGVEFIDDTITLSGADWNFTQHQVFDTVPTEEDFMKTVGDYMSFELSMILQGKGALIGLSDEVLEEAEAVLSGDDDAVATEVRGDADVIA